MATTTAGATDDRSRRLGVGAAAVITNRTAREVKMLDTDRAQVFRSVAELLARLDDHERETLRDLLRRALGLPLQR